MIRFCRLTHVGLASTCLYTRSLSSMSGSLGPPRELCLPVAQLRLQSLDTSATATLMEMVQLQTLLSQYCWAEPTEELGNSAWRLLCNVGLFQEEVKEAELETRMEAMGGINGMCQLFNGVLLLSEGSRQKESSASWESGFGLWLDYAASTPVITRLHHAHQLESFHMTAKAFGHAGLAEACWKRMSQFLPSLSLESVASIVVHRACVLPEANFSSITPTPRPTVIDPIVIESVMERLVMGLSDASLHLVTRLLHSLLILLYVNDDTESIKHIHQSFSSIFTDEVAARLHHLLHRECLDPEDAALVLCMTLLLDDSENVKDTPFVTTLQDACRLLFMGADSLSLESTALVLTCLIHLPFKTPHLALTLLERLHQLLSAGNVRVMVDLDPRTAKACLEALPRIEPLVVMTSIQSERLEGMRTSALGQHLGSRKQTLAQGVERLMYPFCHLANETEK